VRQPELAAKPGAQVAVPKHCLVRVTGCILADDMGLGKTLQGIALLWTLLSSGHPLLGGNPVAKRIIIVCPTSLVGNWDSECQKWLKVGFSLFAS
jgi:SNF2-related domain